MYILSLNLVKYYYLAAERYENFLAVLHKLGHIILCVKELLQRNKVKEAVKLPEDWHFVQTPQSLKNVVKGLAVTLYSINIELLSIIELFEHYQTRKVIIHPFL
ncbi:Hypothetical_protein [Hexamita inflata]|uniref:Hypothetical_protein n=1 Tax=Hexamita inflata TaxID=28002 RepID=A0AA86QNR0_9EUKA|nr:Hypothetical protein HINF_LOCUS50691 [Hexamita inflata]